MVQVILFALMFFFLAMAIKSSARPICPREQAGWNCRRGSGIPCDCEKTKEDRNG